MVRKVIAILELPDVLLIVLGTRLLLPRDTSSDLRETVLSRLTKQ